MTSVKHTDFERDLFLDAYAKRKREDHGILIALMCIVAILGMLFVYDIFVVTSFVQFVGILSLIFLGASIMYHLRKARQMIHILNEDYLWPEYFAYVHTYYSEMASIYDHLGAVGRFLSKQQRITFSYYCPIQKKLPLILAFSVLISTLF